MQQISSCHSPAILLISKTASRALKSLVLSQHSVRRIWREHVWLPTTVSSPANVESIYIATDERSRPWFYTAADEVIVGVVDTLSRFLGYR